MRRKRLMLIEHRGRHRNGGPPEAEAVAAEPHIASVPRVSATALAERDRRLSAGARDLTAALMGDPPKGYSALDFNSSSLMDDTLRKRVAGASEGI